LILLEIKNFFETYKKLQNKEIKVYEILGKDEAYKTLLHIIDNYNKRYKKREKVIEEI